MSFILLQTNMATTTETIAPLSPVDMMRAMAAKYSTEFPIHIGETVIHGSTAARLGRDVVLVTGTTGSLGCHLLETLVSAQDVGRIYALNRAAKDNMPLRERQALGLIERGIDTRILDSSKVVLLEGDLTKPDWGLHTETFLEVSAFAVESDHFQKLRPVVIGAPLCDTHNPQRCGVRRYPPPRSLLTDDVDV